MHWQYVLEPHKQGRGPAGFPCSLSLHSTLCCFPLSCLKICKKKAVFPMRQLQMTLDCLWHKSTAESCCRLRPLQIQRGQCLNCRYHSCRKSYRTTHSVLLSLKPDEGAALEIRWQWDPILKPVTESPSLEKEGNIWVEKKWLFFLNNIFILWNVGTCHMLDYLWLTLEQLSSGKKKDSYFTNYYAIIKVTTQFHTCVCLPLPRHHLQDLLYSEQMWSRKQRFK